MSGTMTIHFGSIRSPVCASESETASLTRPPGKFVKLATVVADTSHVAQRLATMRVHDGKEYEWLEMPFKILFQFGDTEMKAYLSWDENVSILSGL